MRGVDSPAEVGFVEVVNTIAQVKAVRLDKVNIKTFCDECTFRFAKGFFFCNAHKRKTMLLELIVESVGFIGEVFFEGLFEFVVDFASDWLAKRRR